jgi:hypothetical protein
VASFRLQQALDSLRSKEGMMDSLDTATQYLKFLMDIGSAVSEVGHPIF